LRVLIAAVATVSAEHVYRIKDDPAGAEAALTV
jgi:hypothetical protein